MFGFLRRFRKEQSAPSNEAVAESKVELENEIAHRESVRGSEHELGHDLSEDIEPTLSLEQAEPEVEAVVQSLAGEELTPPVADVPVSELSHPLPQPAPRLDPRPSFKTEDISEQKKGLWTGLRTRLARTRKSLTEGLASLVLGKKQIDDELLEDIETRLLLADVGMDTTRTLISALTQKVKRKDLSSPVALLEALYQHMVSLLEVAEQPFQIQSDAKPMVVLVVGINGAGKTTSIGKIGQRLHGEGHSVILAAGDTFRAAAVEQLQTWGERVGVPVIAQASGADSAGVIFDALQAARARGADVLLADTAGRLHTQDGLMEELKKVKRVLAKLDPTAPHEILLVLDASIGQNALNQAMHFHQALGVTGLVVTKLDGTAKAGILFAITHKLGLPIRYIGVGERAEDLRPFNAREFVNAILDRDE
ncbi:MAG: signal recognition particle-docking protein FtsY [Gammaproteobacteria bacterium 28-57-27]|nr:MAG: signal recognition particle-docking protein FtsY [Gammaproteobacteria bacterium 28-57-27]